MADSSVTDWIQSVIAFFQLILSGFGIYYVIKAFQQGARNLEIANQNIVLANENNKMQADAFRNSIRPHFEIVLPTATEIPYGDRFWHVFAFTVTHHDAIDVKFLAFSTEYIDFYDVQTRRITNQWQLTRMKIGDRLAIYIKVDSVNLTDEQMYLLKKRKPFEFKIEIHITFSDASGNTYLQSVLTTLDDVSKAGLNTPQLVNWDGSPRE
ncbi:hypothetical protein [Dyadobacter sp. 22481]|uniref:hypothetical protein n=1 Tax=Dyadobacter sp. 22481 TaxID=3453926 RepID=UPI003F84E32C